MKKFFRLVFVAAFTLVTGSAFAQMPSLPNDPSVRVGKLDNGLTYYIRHNENPAKRAEFYLATNVGAIQEEYPAQDGLAHFLEHMCFNGTAHFPDKGILDYLRSIGAEFGRNINASTGFEETQYMLNNIPVERESVVDTCLMILCDYSHFVNNDPAEIDKERGVIIEERRTRRTADWRTMERSLPYWFAGTKMANCTLIGTQEHLETFKPQSLVDFYRTWYHPGNQAVVVVGDVDVDRTEAKIKEIFGVIPAVENPRQKEHLSVPENEEPVIGIITDPESTSISIDMIWRSEAMPEAYNSEVMGKMMDLLKMIIRQVMYERMQDITSSPDSPFLSGGFYLSSLIYEDIDAAEASVGLKENSILDGFAAFYTEILRMKRHGFTDAEIERAKTDILSSFETRMNKADTRRNAEFIRPILSHFFDNKPFMDPAMDYQVTSMLLQQLSAPAINPILEQIITPNNLVVIYSGPEKAGIATPTEAQILGVMRAVEASDIAALDGEELPTEFLNPAKLKGGKVKKESTTVFGATQWILKNGVKVVVLPTDYTKDQILIDFYKQGGLSLVSDADCPSMTNGFSFYLSNTGISSFSSTQVSKMLTGKNVSVEPYVENLEHGISATSTVRDLETAFQLMYLDFTAPRFDAKEFETGLAQVRAILPNYENTPDYRFSKEYMSVLYGNNPRRQTLSMEMLDKISLAAIERNYRSLFKDVAGATLVIVGDVKLDELKPLVEKYFGSLPKGKKPSKWIDRNVDIVPGRITDILTVDMQTPKSTVLQVATKPMAFSYETRIALDALKYILDMRYTNSLREDEGGTYGASVAAQINRVPKSVALLQVYFDCNPAICDRLREIAVDGLRLMAEQGPTESEVAMARQNLLKNIPENRQNNSYWRGQIESFLDYGDTFDAVREGIINNLTAEQIRSIAAALYDSNNFVEVVMMPGQTAE